MADETAHTEVPGGGHPFPPFDRTTYPSQLFWLAVTFVALYLLMGRIALPRIGAIIEKRKGRIEGDFAEATRLKGESEAAIAAYERALADARARAQALVNEQRQRQVAEAEKERKALDARLSARIAAAEAGIATSKAAAMENLCGIATEAATAIVQRLAGVAPASPDAAAQAVAEALKH
ncbi:MAG TPA: F0F1 ATP synthase subunit B' [Xanthobacteraceae bacterium]|jgi:F-type H+-transporting ATPase subunit b|nr:F0F1 ATP synthase subunit B' [Xanthobacteraceae bacterium]